MNATVLLAEDEPVSRAFLCDALQALGVACDVAADGDAAVARAMATRYDALLLDLNLPLRDGLQILAAVRGDVRCASRATPALALTADASAGTRARLLAGGFAGVACKPIGVDALAAALAGVGLRAAPAGGGDAAVWDEQHALAAAGGNRTIADTLRRMLLQELPRQRDGIVDAITRGDGAAARAELHRLQAACGFCGATALLAAVRALQGALGDVDTVSAVDAIVFRRAVDDVLGDPASQVASHA